MKHTNKILIILSLVVLAVLFIGCRTTQPIVQEKYQHDSIYIERHDTLVKIEPDKASMRLLVECDSAGNVLLLALEQEQGKRLALQAQLTQQDQGTMLTIDCKQDSLIKVIEGLRERISLLQDNSETKVVREKYVPPFYKWCAWIVCIAVAVLVLWFIIWVAVRCRRI